MQLPPWFHGRVDMRLLSIPCGSLVGALARTPFQMLGANGRRVALRWQRSDTTQAFLLGQPTYTLSAVSLAAGTITGTVADPGQVDTVAETQTGGPLPAAAPIAGTITEAAKTDTVSLTDPARGVTGTLTPSVVGVTQGLPQGYYISTSRSDLLLAANAGGNPFVQTDGGVLFVDPSADLELDWPTYGSHIQDEWYVVPLGLTGNAQSNRYISVVEISLVSGTIEDYIKYCRAKE